MEEAKRARKAETPKQPSRHLRSSAPYFYPDPHYVGLKREEREKGDARILGSGDFVSTTLEQSERGEKKYLPKCPIEELVEAVAGKLDLKPDLICSGNRQRHYSEARSLVAWLAVEEIGHPAAEVARFLGISRVGVLLSLEKAKDICQKYEFQLTRPTLQI